jgi:hypothetical protein
MIMSRLPLFSVLLLTACSSTSSNGTTGNQSSPLGIGYPNPTFVLTKIQEGLRDGDWPRTCEHLAALGHYGQPGPLVPGTNVKSVPSKSLQEMEAYLPLFDALKRPWVSFRYGSIRSLMNDPPFFAVPVDVEYRYDQISEEERALMLSRYREEKQNEATWEEFVAAMRKTERQGEGQREIAFAHLRGNWRLYLGAIPGGR